MPCGPVKGTHSRIPAPPTHPRAIEARSPSRARPRKLVKIGARIVRHGRYLVFQLAEVAVPRSIRERRRDGQDK
jgi:hypothetical protein